MRNPDRIPINFSRFYEILETLNINDDIKNYLLKNKYDILRIWIKNPDMRLAQLLFNCTNSDIFDKMYNQEDDKFISELKYNYTKSEFEKELELTEEEINIDVFSNDKKK